MKKILLNGLQLSNQNAGVQYYTEYLFKALNEIKTVDFEFDIIQNYIFEQKNKSSLKRILFETFLLRPYIKNNHFDLYHSPHYIIPNSFKLPAIVTIHDLITLDFPELCKNQSNLYFRLFFKSTIRNAKLIITVSQTVKKDIIKHFDVDEQKIRVIYLGVDNIFKKTMSSSIRLKYGLPKKYILFVGNMEGKKNLTRLVMAFKELINHNKIEHKLVLVGKKGWKIKSLYKTISNYNLQDHILFTGYVPKQHLPAIYSMADLFVFPSIYEGFGIPPLEAMACETPVIISNQGASPEICGDACLQVNPFDINDIMNGMKVLLSNKELRKQKISLGLKRVKQFNWSKAANETLKVYEEALNF